MIELGKDSVDLGIVTANEEAMVQFYRDQLGLVEEPSTPFPGGGTMRRLRCGTSLIKVVVPAEAPSATPAPGPIPRASGYRYWTMTVTNLEDIMSKLEASGVTIRVPITEVRPGVTIGMVEDPDGNWVEFLETAS